MTDQGRAARVLHVNDRPIPRYVTDEVLRRAGFSVTSMETATAALDAVEPEPDLILLDVHLPDIDGFEACRRFKSRPETAHVPVLLTSAAFVTPSSKASGLDSGADGYLVMPFEPAELIATVRALLRTRRAEREAVEALRLREDFLSVASHELKTPLTSMNLQVNALRKLLEDGKWAGVPQQVFQKKLDLLDRQGRYLASLIESLLDISRVRTGHLELQRQVVDLSEIVHKVVAQQAAEIERYGISIDLSASAAVIGFWDPVRLEQVVTNLLSNACKYGERREVLIRVEQKDGHAVLTVKDHGVGISPSDQERIFERFERAAIHPSRPGFGLGLWIARQIVEALGGNISVTSESSKGAAFTVRLQLGEGPRPGEH